MANGVWFTIHGFLFMFGGRIHDLSPKSSDDFVRLVPNLPFLDDRLLHWMIDYQPVLALPRTRILSCFPSLLFCIIDGQVCNDMTWVGLWRVLQFDTS